ncbi:hypothetical protein EXIGLDRAFT_734082 [Exidia glandulosa HHB12029]|uniref:Uncharacterized protein n=1 Tax=Exidia glandulosa HHB12029 TaxID=1314781 RepID=A0A165K970_EXIGL|nr:hypothetical protein EXIGLDRAFT_734082 [Exidia glandulosa HHB12029]
MSMSSVFTVQQVRDMLNDVDINVPAPSDRLSSPGKPRAQRPGSYVPPPVPPPTRTPTPQLASPPQSKYPYEQSPHTYTFIPPLTPAHFAVNGESSSPPSSPEDSRAQTYFFVPPLTPLDFQMGTSELWKALDADPADLENGFRTETYEVFQARARRRPRPAARNLWNQEQTGSESGGTSPKKTDDEDSASERSPRISA